MEELCSSSRQQTAKIVIFEEKETAHSLWGHFLNYGAGKWSPRKQQWSLGTEETEIGFKGVKMSRIGGIEHLQRRELHREGTPEILDLWLKTKLWCQDPIGQRIATGRFKEDRVSRSHAGLTDVGVPTGLCGENLLKTSGIQLRVKKGHI